MERVVSASIDALQSWLRTCQITIPTGGVSSDLIGRQVEAILQKCPDTQIVVNLSIDHIGEKHDWIRGVPGNYEKLKKTYANLVPLKSRFPNFAAPQVSGSPASAMWSRRTAALRCTSILCGPTTRR